MTAGWLVVWEVVAGRLAGSGSWLRGSLPTYLAEALLLTLLGALWFASLGHGGWLLVFILVGLLMEWPLRFGGSGPRTVKPGRRLLWLIAGTLRIVLAGGILAWTLS